MSEQPREERMTFSAHVLAGRVARGTRMRLSLDNPSFGVPNAFLFQGPPDSEQDWRSGGLDARTLDRISTADLLNLLSNLSPDLSRALWDFLRMTNPGHEVKVYGRDGKTVDERGQASADAFLGRLKARYGSVDVVIHRLFLNAFLRGGFFAELVLANNGRQALDIATPDSRYLFFERDNDPEIGFFWRPFQYQMGKRVYLDRPTVRYVPIDPLPGSPFGRAPAQPAIFTIMFALGLLHDLRRVVQQQGWPRPDITMDLDELLKKMPPEAAASNTTRDKWLEDMVSQIETHFSRLEPDDAYIHTSDIVMNRPQGTVDSSSLGAVDGLIDALDKQAVRALKTNPLMFGISEGGSDSQHNRAWEIYAQGIKSFQHLGEGLLEYFLTLALQAEGLQGTIEFRFAELRAAELLRDAQVRKLDMQNASLAYARGWIGQDEAAQMALGRDTADVPEPRIPTAGIQAAGAGGGATNPDNVQADPGSARARLISLLGEDVFDGYEQITNGNGNGHR